MMKIVGRHTWCSQLVRFLAFLPLLFFFHFGPPTYFISLNFCRGALYAVFYRRHFFKVEYSCLTTGQTHVAWCAWRWHKVYVLLVWFALALLKIHFWSLLDSWSLLDACSILLFQKSLSRRDLLGKLKLPLLDMLFDLIMSFARSRLCWCLAKRWSRLIHSCCGVYGATIKFTQAFVSFSRLHKRATSFAARSHLKITTLTLTWCSLRTTSAGKVLTDGLPHFTSCDGVI